MSVILVDDEKLNLENLESIVKELLPGATPVSFNKASSGLEYVHSHPVDIAFLDINIRGIDGMTIARILGEKYPWRMSCSAPAIRSILWMPGI